MEKPVHFKIGIALRCSPQSDRVASCLPQGVGQQPCQYRGDDSRNQRSSTDLANGAQRSIESYDWDEWEASYVGETPQERPLFPLGTQRGEQPPTPESMPNR